MDAGIGRLDEWAEAFEATDFEADTDFVDVDGVITAVLGRGSATFVCVGVSGYTCGVVAGELERRAIVADAEADAEEEGVGKRDLVDTSGVRGGEENVEDGGVVDADVEPDLQPEDEDEDQVDSSELVDDIDGDRACRLDAPSWLRGTREYLVGGALMLGSTDFRERVMRSCSASRWDALRAMASAALSIASKAARCARMKASSSSKEPGE